MKNPNINTDVFNNINGLKFKLNIAEAFRVVQ